MTDIDKAVLGELEESELTRNDPMPTTAVGARPHRERAQVYSVRLAPEVVRQIEQVATERDVNGSTVVRGFVLAGLAEHKGNPGSVAASIDRAIIELERFRGLL